MDISCPKCRAHYRIADSAVPPEGRAITCAQCGESWHEPRMSIDEIAMDPGPLGASVADAGGVDTTMMNAATTVYGPAAEPGAHGAPADNGAARGGGGLGTIGWIIVLVVLGIAAAVGYGVYSGQLSLH